MAPGAGPPPCATTASVTTTSACAHRVWLFHADLIPWAELPEAQKDINRHALDWVTAEHARDSRTPPFTLPVLDDACSIRASLTQINRLLAAGQIERKTASLMLYSLQIATSNLELAARELASLEKVP